MGMMGDVGGVGVGDDNRFRSFAPIGPLTVANLPSGSEGEAAAAAAKTAAEAKAAAVAEAAAGRAEGSDSANGSLDEAPKVCSVAYHKTFNMYKNGHRYRGVHMGFFERERKYV